MSSRRIPITALAALAMSAALSCRGTEQGAGDTDGGITQTTPGGGQEPIATAPPAEEEQPVVRPEEERAAGEVATGTSATREGLEEPGETEMQEEGTQGMEERGGTTQGETEERTPPGVP